jgi:hypothetical protein
MEELKFPKTLNRDSFESKLILDVLTAIKAGTIKKILYTDIIDLIRTGNKEITDRDIINWYLNVWLEFLQLNGGIEEIKDKIIN